MKALRYLLIVVAILSVMGVSAQTPQYGKLYNPQHSFVRAANTPVDAQMPAATMGSIDAGYMQSGSSLPMAAQSGVTTTFDRNNTPSRPRKGWGSGEGGEPGSGGEGGEPGDWHEPWEDPIGDAMWPMMMLALVYAIYKVSRMRRREGVVGLNPTEMDEERKPDTIRQNTRQTASLSTRSGTKICASCRNIGGCKSHGGLISLQFATF